jgi:hypothetical protein
MTYVYEFLWRGHADGSVAYHVILADEVEALGQTQHVESIALTPEHAAEQGFPLETIIENINAQALIARDRAIAERDALQRERDAVIAGGDDPPREP